MTAKSFDVAVVGGGLLGSAVAFGLSRLGQRVAVLDEGDKALRAARANFGLVWVQTKGDGLPPYADWTRSSAEAHTGSSALTQVAIRLAFHSGLAGTPLAKSWWPSSTASERMSSSKPIESSTVKLLKFAA